MLLQKGTNGSLGSLLGDEPKKSPDPSPQEYYVRPFYTYIFSMDASLPRCNDSLYTIRYDIKLIEWAMTMALFNIELLK